MSEGKRSSSRRIFLKSAALSAAGWAVAAPGARSAEEASSPGAKRATGPGDSPVGPLVRLSDHLWVYRGAIQVGVVRDRDRALLIDCGDASVLAALPQAGITRVDRVLFTHHHRDQACGVYTLAQAGAKIEVPAAERAWFDNVAAYWSDPKHRWHIYNQHPHHLMLAEPVRVDATHQGGEEFSFGPARIRVLATPGHTDGSVSYLVEVDGQRVAFCGDMLYDEGRIWELYSLQKGTVTSDYHGFLGARPQLVESLRRLEAAQPDRLVPSHGQVIEAPGRAIQSLVRRLDACYDKYVAISALRHYFPKMFSQYAGRPDHMPIRPGRPAPECLRHFGTTWVLLSRDKAALVMDCGSPQVVQRLRGLMDQGQVRSIEALWITHYHDDHVDGVPAFRQAFSCPVLAEEHVAQVIANPLAWRLPCISPHAIRVDRVLSDGQSWSWHEFRMTAYHFPGQTLYHGGLLAEAGPLRMFFVGDSFTMAGIDDYCAHNRNWLGEGVGFDRCLALLEKLRPTHLFNPHVDQAFDFTAEQYRFMRENLAQREKLFGELFPWDHPNYGMDELWVRCFPYEQKAPSGGSVQVEIVVTNHSAVAHAAACRPVLPRAWKAEPQPWVEATVVPKREGRLAVRIALPAGLPPGRYVIPFDIRYGQRLLPQWTEAILVV